jgi:hypothetical protein
LTISREIAELILRDLKIPLDGIEINEILDAYFRLSLALEEFAEVITTQSNVDRKVRST